MDSNGRIPDRRDEQQVGRDLNTDPLPGRVVPGSCVIMKQKTVPDPVTPRRQTRRAPIDAKRGHGRDRFDRRPWPRLIRASEKCVSWVPLAQVGQNQVYPAKPLFKVFDVFVEHTEPETCQTTCAMLSSNARRSPAPTPRDTMSPTTQALQTRRLHDGRR
jgi:hypothetical protein